MSSDLSYDSRWGEVREEVRLSLQNRLRELGLPEEVYSRISRGGRLNRAVLFLMVANPDAEKRKRRVAVDLAVALEMIHKASVIRDDIEDADFLRRGLPTERAIMGVPGALALSDVLLTGGLAVIQRLEPAAIKRVLNALLNMSRGQFCDLQGPLAPEDPFGIAELKTGSLVALVFWMGGLHADRSRGDRRLLHTMGMHLGTAFQLANDVNNVTRNEGRGKLPGSDLAEHRNSAISQLIDQQAGEFPDAVESSIDLAVERTCLEIARRLGEAKRIASLLKCPLPEGIHLLVSDEKTARSFVGDQQ
ncbi:polyprenyl synthetase family protein [Streptomyces koelreuteriae]|uniref:polyprenyl synthetase family protein n=1 Tax=Streptomyces koelreuteriae TaxID=2838015 RepID=UPI003EBB804C